MKTRWGDNWYQSVGWALFSLRGRIRRATFALGSLLLAVVLWFFLAQIVAAEEESGRLIVWTLGFIILTALSVWCIIALTVKRLHDVSLSGWLALLLFIPGVWAFAFLFLALLPGKPEENIYGPPPVKAGGGPSS